MIARLLTQRACLDEAARLIRDLPGPILEIGLGKARTYDRLRALFPDREIFALDRDVHCPPELAPDAAHLLLGDFRETLQFLQAGIGRGAALAHADIGSHDRARDARLAADITPLIARLVRPGGVVATDREMPGPGWQALPLPEGAGVWPYYLYRVGR